MNQTNTKRILVIEDNENNLYLIRFLLESNNYAVLIAKDGKIGVEMARVEKPDLILMDIQLPVMDGYTATKLLKSDSATSFIPIIVLTSYVMPGDKKKAEESGCDSYIAKPIEPDQVLKDVKRFLDTPGSK